MSEMKWLKITIQTVPILIDPISDFLVGVLEAGVEEGARDEPDYGTLTSYFQIKDSDLQETGLVMEKLSEYLAKLAEVFRVPMPKITPSFLENEDWSSTWKQYFKPFAIVPGLTIVPSWEKYQPVPQERVITMDPGMAFGTGHHATTTLCVELLYQALQSHPCAEILDVGTGTGILGMAAILFGARSVLGIDNDPEAVAAATKNIAANGLTDKMQVDCRLLADLSGQFPIIVANIIHDVLLALADDFTRLTKKGGELILSGILVGEQAKRITDFFEAKGFILVERRERQEWAALLFKNEQQLT